LHAPQAGFGDVEFYPDIYDKVAVLVCRLAWNHPLPDGNKRAAWAALVMFIDLKYGTWDPDPPNIDEAEEAMLAIAGGDVDEAWTAVWLRERVRFVD
jgi:death-on-curing protein